MKHHVLTSLLAGALGLAACGGATTMAAADTADRTSSAAMVTVGAESAAADRRDLRSTPRSCGTTSADTLVGRPAPARLE